MSMIKVSFVVPHEAYSMLQASAARAGLALPVYVRDAVFRDAQIDAQALEAMPEASPKLTRTKRDLLTLLLNHKSTNAGAPYLTTSQIGATLQQCDQSIYINLRSMVRDGLVERGQNLQRGMQAGAPSKTYTISALGERVLSDDQTRVTRVFQEFQARSQAAYAAIDAANAPPKPQIDPSRVHAALRYIAMAQLGRAIESETDVDTMKATHARLCAAADRDVAEGAHTYDQILEKVTAKIQALGGQEAISERFNIG